MKKARAGGPWDKNYLAANFVIPIQPAVNNVSDQIDSGAYRGLKPIRPVVNTVVAQLSALVKKEAA